ncbi:TPA: AAA family ATPase [Clostridium botulinum]|nr:AAA family ATPase [Clostridium botulinum]
MKKVTIINPQGGLSKIEDGTKVILVKEPDNKWDSSAIKCLSESGEHLGYVGASVNTIISGCISNKELFNAIKSNKIEGTVIEKGKVTMNRSYERTALVVKVMGSNANQKEKANINTKGKQFVVKVKGALRQYPGKVNVIKDFKNNGTVYVTLKSEDQELHVFYNETLAGIIDNKKYQDTSDYEDISEILKSLGQYTAKVTDVSSSTYTAKFTIDEKTLDDAKKGKKIINLDDIKSEIIAQGINTADALNEIEQYLSSCGVSRKHIVNIFKSYQKYDESVVERIPKKPETLFKDYFGGVKKSIIYILKGKHLRYIGEKGTGKNNLVTTVAWLFQRPLYELSLNSQFDKMDLLGSKGFEQGVGEDGQPYSKITFDKESFIEAMEVGGFINLDEVNTADPSILVQLHSVADDRGSLQVAGYGNVKSNKNFGMILTMNKDYVGTNQLNEATRDRFTPILFPSNESIADMLASKFPKIDANTINYADQIYSSILTLIKDGELSMDCITVRGFIDAVEVSEDLGLQESLIDNVANRIEDDEYRQHVLNIIDDIVG